jgi:hypothetical protein
MRILALFLVLASACTTGVQDIYEVPANPTYDKDVRFYLADHCVLCHGSPPNRGAPSNFRLDVYDDDPNKDVLGAHTMAITEAITRAMDRNMPPGGGLGPNGKAMMKLWVEKGAPR